MDPMPKRTSKTKTKTTIVEEYAENQATGVEEEDSESDSQSLDKPYDPSKIRVDPRTFSLRQILDMIDDSDLELTPDFQRKKVWKPREKSRLIESLLLRIPLPAFYFSADHDGRMRVVDGLQRLSTVQDFVRGGDDGKGGFILANLEYLDEGVSGKRACELDATWTRRINQTQIYVNVIDPQTPAQVKFDIFKRINTGGAPLKAQEIRHCMSDSRSRDFLKACTGGYRYAGPDETQVPFAGYKKAEGVLPKGIYNKANNASEAFHEATGWRMWDHVRMADREVILRFCAFRLLGEELDDYREHTSMDEFLTVTTQNLDNKDAISDKQLGELAEDLELAMKNAQLLFGEHAFRKWPKDTDSLNPINRALFESWSVALADYEPAALKPHKKAIVLATRQRMTDDSEYIDAISVGTGDHSKVKRRFSVAREIIDEVVR
jgi:hypothetical protein